MLSLILVPIAIIDFKTQLIPNVLILGGLVLRLILYSYIFYIDKNSLLEILKINFEGMAFGAGIFLLCGFIMKNSVGMGDVKLFGLIGLFLGFNNAFSVIFFTLVICCIFSIVLLASKKKKKKDVIPMAPFTFIGLLLAVCLGL